MTRQQTFRALAVCGCLLLAASGGCRAKPAPDAGFLTDPALMRPSKNIPFNRIWINPAYQPDRYTEIYVAPVNTDHVMAQNIWEKATLGDISRADVQKNVHALAEYLRQAVVKAAEKDPKKRFTVVDYPGPNTLVLEMAIVQLVPSKAELNAIGMLPFGVVGVITTGVEMGASAATNSEDQGKGVIAIEARTRDELTGEVTSMFADREHPPTAIVDLKAISWWAPVKSICDDWAREFIAVHDNPHNKKIKKISNFQPLVF
jgi:hypothetical protein